MENIHIIGRKSGIFTWIICGIDSTVHFMKYVQTQLMLQPYFNHSSFLKMFSITNILLLLFPLISYYHIVTNLLKKYFQKYPGLQSTGFLCSRLYVLYVFWSKNRIIFNDWTQWSWVYCSGNVFIAIFQWTYTTCFWLRFYMNWKEGKKPLPHPHPKWVNTKTN